MSDTTTLPSGESALSLSQAVAEMRGSREAGSSQSDEPNPVSEAARTLGKAAAEKRKAAQTENEPEPDEEEEEFAEDETQVTEDDTDQADEDADESDAEEEDEDEDPEEGNLDSITLPDGETITVEEAAKGYLRQADYTRKTQALSQKQREVEAHVEQRLKQLDELLTTFQPEPEPDWNQLAQEDPDWGLRKLQWDKQQQQRAAALNELKNHQQQSLAQAQRDTVQELTSGDYKPEWSDQATFQKDLQRIEDFALSLGASQEDVASFYAPWHIKVFDMAMQAQERSKKVETAKKKVVNKPKVIRSKSRSGLKSAVSRGVEQAQAAFDANPSIENGKALMRAQRKATQSRT